MDKNSRHLSWQDRALMQFDRALRTVANTQQATTRPSPAANVADAEMDNRERHHAAGLMRINHTGEVCAQALYQGQSLTANLPEVRASMEAAAAEEIDHLRWCEERVNELGDQCSILNPLWYALSFGIGAGAGLVGDKISLGFVAATEDQVCEHLQSHLQKLPGQDKKSRAIVEQMLVDERKHGHTALAAGGTDFPAPIKRAMSIIAKLMTALSYKI